MAQSTRSKGALAEEYAETYLLKKGWKLLAANVFYITGEIDRIFAYQGMIIFVEVKSITESKSSSIYSRLTSKKKQRLQRAINTWIGEHKKWDADWRVDFIGIEFTGKLYRVIHESYIDLRT